MLQIIQHQKTGRLTVGELPAPQLHDGYVLVRNVCSLVSAGTERTSVETAQASLIGKARSRPDLVKQVMDHMRREGIAATYAKVKNRLDNYKELGYSSAGVVTASAVDSFGAGDRVACAGTAHHAEIVAIPKNLLVKIPDGLDFSQATFTALGAIALQGVRQANVHMGESVAVVGLGLIGLLTVQILRASGCRVFGIDLSQANFSLARNLGCDLCALSNPQTAAKVNAFSCGFGMDAVILTASTPSNQPLELALQVARKKGSVVVVGAVGMNVPRAPFYEKELNLTIASSYGPGRYDQSYEIKGIDYPIGYVRWTENRNMEAVLDLMAQRKLNVEALITHRFPIKDALKAYDIITGKRREKSVGILIEYPGGGSLTAARRVDRATAPRAPRSAACVVGFIGAGNFAQSYLLPFLKGSGVELRGVATSRPVNAQSVARKFDFGFFTCDPKEVLEDKSINTLFVATRHDSHARFVVGAMKRGKNVFVEKPLAISAEGLREIIKARATAARNCAPVMVGFNRRFSRPIIDMLEFLSQSKDPMTINYRVNAGTLNPAHWLHDPAQGGRIVGEACHFIDCMQFLTGARPVRVFAESVPRPSSPSGAAENVSVAIRFSDDSVGNLLYLADGDPAVGKEYCEVHRGGMTAIMNNFDEAIFSNQGKKLRKRYDGGKGHEEEVKKTLEAFSSGRELIAFESLCATTEVTFKILESLHCGQPVEIP